MKFVDLSACEKVVLILAAHADGLPIERDAMAAAYRLAVFDPCRNAAQVLTGTVRRAIERLDGAGLVEWSDRYHRDLSCWATAAGIELAMPELATPFGRRVVAAGITAAQPRRRRRGRRCRR